MALKELKEKVRHLMPWNWGKKPVRVQGGEGRSLPAARDEFSPLFGEFLDRAFGRHWPALSPPIDLLGGDWPRVDLEETDREFTVTAEVPGMAADDIDVFLTDRSLTIQGAKQANREHRKGNYHLVETYSGSFHRTIPLPADVDVGRVEAHHKNGQLAITLPKTRAGRAATKRIEVK